MNKSFWGNKKILVTGHTGFKGSWLSLWLQKLGADVVGISLEPPTNPSLFDQACVGDRMVSLNHDIRDGEKVKEIFQKHQPEIIFHLAAQPLVRYSYKNPVETYETNVMGTMHILEAIRFTESVRSAVMITTDKCYHNKEWVWGYRETDSLGGHDPYSSSKGAAELLIASYRDSFFSSEKYNEHMTAVASVRAGNVIGGGDWAEDRLVPDIIRAFQENKKVIIRNPESTRPWQHVLEPLSGYIHLAEKLYEEGYAYAEPWNFGPHDNDAKSVKWIVKEMADIWKNGAGWGVNSQSDVHEANYLKLDCSKAHIKLGWSPKWSLNHSLKKIIDWHKVASKTDNCREICLGQIEQYMKDMSNENY